MEMKASSSQGSLDELSADSLERNKLYRGLSRDTMSVFDWSKEQVLVIFFLHPIVQKVIHSSFVANLH